jgi:hypothetical protein
LTCVYGEAQTGEHHKTWDMLKFIKTSSHLSWLCIGDFNNVLHREEHCGVQERSYAQIAGFCEAMDVCGLLALALRNASGLSRRKLLGDPIVESNLIVHSSLSTTAAFHLQRHPCSLLQLRRVRHLHAALGLSAGSAHPRRSPSTSALSQWRIKSVATSRGRGSSSALCCQPILRAPSSLGAGTSVLLGPLHHAGASLPGGGLSSALGRWRVAGVETS